MGHHTYRHIAFRIPDKSFRLAHRNKSTKENAMALQSSKCRSQLPHGLYNTSIAFQTSNKTCRGPHKVYAALTYTGNSTPAMSCGRGYMMRLPFKYKYISYKKKTTLARRLETRTPVGDYTTVGLICLDERKEDGITENVWRAISAITESKTTVILCNVQRGGKSGRSVSRRISNINIYCPLP